MALRERIIRLVHYEFNLSPRVKTARRIMEMLDDPRSSASDIESLALKDPALCANILKTANSAYYGVPREVKTVRDAITILGFKTVKSVVLLSLFKKPLRKEIAKVLDEKDFWDHSFKTAIVAKKLAPPEMQEEVYSAALLHDIGILFLAQNFASQYIPVLQTSTYGQILVEEERKNLGIDHAEVGGEIAKTWNFPDSLVKAIILHHSPEADLQSQVVAVANLATRNEPLPPEFSVSPELYERALEVYKETCEKE